MLSRMIGMAALGFMALGLAPGAAGAATTTTNWAGYGAVRSGVKYRKVTSSWVVPKVTCTAGTPTYSAAWIGLGGYSETSQALEQLGTEADCNARGKAVYSSWWEIVPANAYSAGMRIHAGDRMSATVTVVGHRVRMTMKDRTTGATFAKSATPSVVDVTSAEWIQEAPSACTTASDSSCVVLPLADFGTMRFSAATVTTVGGRTGKIASSHWSAKRIDLVSNPFSLGGGGRLDAGDSLLRAATAGALASSGDAFSVTYAESSLVRRTLARRAAAASTATATTPVGVVPEGARIVH
jgi:hypothetical protein